METKAINDVPFTRHEYSLKYYDDNRDKLNEYQKKYYLENKNKLKLARESESYKEAQKRFYEKHPNYWNNYYAEKKDIINKRKREVNHLCEVCNIQIKKAHISDHSRTKKHIKNSEK